MNLDNRKIMDNRKAKMTGLMELLEFILGWMFNN